MIAEANEQLVFLLRLLDDQMIPQTSPYPAERCFQYALFVSNSPKMERIRILHPAAFLDRRLHSWLGKSTREREIRLVVHPSARAAGQLVPGIHKRVRGGQCFGDTQPTAVCRASRALDKSSKTSLCSSAEIRS